MINKKKLYWSITVAISIVAIFFGVYYSSNIKEFANKSDAAADVSLYIEPVSSDILTNTVLVPKLRINPTTNAVTAIEAYLTFDAGKLSMESITPASNYIILKQPSIDNTAGTASFTVGIKGGVNMTPSPVVTVSDVASIRVKSKTTVGEAIIRVSNNSKVAAKNVDTNVASTFGQASINVSNVIAPTPTATTTIFPNWDVNEDTYINVLDIGIVSDNYDSSSPTNPRADVNRDGFINIIDIGIIVDHYI